MISRSPKQHKKSPYFFNFANFFCNFNGKFCISVTYHSEKCKFFNRLYKQHKFCQSTVKKLLSSEISLERSKNFVNQQQSDHIFLHQLEKNCTFLKSVVKTKRKTHNALIFVNLYRQLCYKQNFPNFDSEELSTMV